MTIWSASFWKNTAERVISAFVLSLLGVFGTAEGLDLSTVKWGQILTAAGVIAGLTLGKCIVAGTGFVGPKGSPSLVADPAAAGQLLVPVALGPALPSQQEILDRLKPEFGPSNIRKVTPPTTYTTGGYTGGDLPKGDAAPPG